MRVRPVFPLSVLAASALGALTVPAFAGNADILWRNSATGANVLWKSGSAATPAAVTAVANASWQVVGAGDFDYDGGADTLWRQAATGANVIWRGCNASRAMPVAAVAAESAAR